jgi:hypothetical protein
MRGGMINMKKVFSILLSVIFALSFLAIDSSETFAASSSLSISGFNVTHTTATFTVSNATEAQDATATITSEKDGSKYNIDFTITNGTQEISLNIPDGSYLVSKAKYDLQVTDKNGDVTNTCTATLYEHSVYPYTCDVYPSELDATFDYDTVKTVTATVGFKTYTGTVSNKKIVITYPTQAIGTKVDVTFSDNYGCTYSKTYTVANKSISNPSVTLYPEAMFTSYDKIASDQRLCLEIGGKTYYSAYGAGGYSGYISVITYPAQPVGTTAKIWIEDNSGSSSSVISKTVNPCELGKCIGSIHAYPGLITGNVKANAYGQTINKISITVNGKTYSTDSIASDGSFALSFPSQAAATKYTIIFSDRHGCSVSEQSSVSNDTDKDSITIDQKNVNLITGTVDLKNTTDNNAISSVTASVDGTVYKGTFKDDTFSIDCSSKVGSKVTVTIVDTHGYIYTSSFTMPNIAPDLSINKITSGTRVISGSTTENSQIAITIKGKTYNLKADEYGDFSVKVGLHKKGTKVKINITSPEGYTLTKTITISKAKGSLKLAKNVYRTSSNIKFKISNANKGDKVVIKIGNRKITKKITSGTNKTKRYSIAIKRYSAGTKIKIAYYDFFGATKSTKSSKVYYSSKIYIGMSSKNALLTPWGKPDYINDYGKGTPDQWVYDFGSTQYYVYVSKGRVVDMQKIHI